MSIETSHAEGLGRVTLTDPPLNILTRSMLAQLREGLAELAAEPSLRAVLLAATGKHFSAGADVGEHLPPTYRELIPEFLDTVLAIATFPLPVVAAVQGRCLGGGFEVAMSADLIVAAEGASFGQPEIMLGVLPPAACALLPFLCGRGAAARIVYTGENLSSADALQAGIVQQVVPIESQRRSRGDSVGDEPRSLSRIVRDHAACERALILPRGDRLTILGRDLVRIEQPRIGS